MSWACDKRRYHLRTDDSWIRQVMCGRALTWLTARSPARSRGGWTERWTTPSGRCSAPPGGRRGPAGVCGTSHCTGELWGGTTHKQHQFTQVNTFLNQTKPDEHVHKWGFKSPCPVFYFLLNQLSYILCLSVISLASLASRPTLFNVYKAERSYVSQNPELNNYIF